MSIFLLYLLLLKATVTSFSGMGSLPMVRNDLVVTRHILTDQELSSAVAVGRSTPGPAGLYIVSVGYFVAGIPGAIAGWLALVTPAVFIIPLLIYVGKRIQHPRIKNALQAVVLAGAGLLLATSLPLAVEAISGVMLGAIALASCLIMAATRLSPIWMILGAAIISLTADAVRLTLASM